jgi:hypothetical protein
MTRGTAALGLAVPVLLALALAPSLEAQGATFYHYGSPVIDGVEGGGEWAGAEAGTVPITMPVALGGGTSDVTFLFMNDENNLYFAVRLPWGVSPLNGELLGLDGVVWRNELDYCEPATVVDEWLLVSQNEDQLYYDMFREYLSGCDRQPQTPDDSAGGTTEGNGQWGDDGLTTFFEIAHPLDTADDLHDLSAVPGDRVQVAALAAGCDSVDCGVPAELQRRVFLASPGLFFLGDQEAGDTSDWTSSTP